MIIANENGLEKVTGLPAVKVLNVCYNKLKKIEGFPVLEELYCSNNLIHTISDIPNVEIIDCYKNDLTKILYFPKLKEIIFDFNDRLSIDTRYKIGHVHKSDLRKLMHLTMG
jgi:Leucine-rich repeat (LRR) protein